MRKVLKNFGLIASVICITILLIQCNDKEETKYGTLSGSVGLEDGTVADGAIVTLSTEANAANILARVVVDENGMYSIIGIQSGTYYINAKWEPSNNNNLLKSANTVILSGVESELTVEGDQTSDIVLAGLVSDGNGMVDLDDGWVWDNTHSMIGFEFPYDAVNAVFSGHFSSVGFDEMNFDETAPQNTVIRAWVDITSVETGSPSPPCGHGRDGITGCITNSFKVQKDPADTVDNYCSDGSVYTSWPNEELEEYDLWGEGAVTTYMKQSAIVGSTGVATFVSTEVTPYGTGYLAKGDFTFAGVTKNVDMYFSYLEGYTNDDNTRTYASFYGWFKYAALDDFDISSGHVGDAEITVKLSAQFNKPL